MISLAETCLLARWHPVLRWHDSHIGPYKELVNQFTDDKGAAQVGNPYKCQSTNAVNWDGVVSSSDESSVMEWERRDYIFWQFPRDNQIILGRSKWK